MPGIGIGISPLFGRKRGIDWSRYWTPQYQNVYNAFETKPSAATAIAQARFVKSLVSSGVWAKLVCIIPSFACETPADALLWWNNVSRKGTVTDPAPVFAQLSGFSGDGTAYVDTTFNPSVDGGGIYTQNNASLGFLFTNNRSASQVYSNGVSAAGISGAAITPFYLSKVYGQINSDFNGGLACDGTSNLFILSRGASDSFKTYVNKIDLGDSSVSSGTLVNGTLKLLVRDNIGSFIGQSYDTIGAFFAGSGLTSSDVSILVDALSQLDADLRNKAWVPFITKVRLNIDTYVVGNNDVIHVDVINTGTAWNGYKYWMAITPYPAENAEYENPSIYCSNDLITWTTPIGLTNPVIPAIAGDDYNADPCLYFDGLKLYMAYITSVAPLSIYMTESEDGVTWSESQSILSVDGIDTAVSIPSIIKVGSFYYIYYLSSLSTRQIKRKRSESIYGPYTNAENVSLSLNVGETVGHFGVKYIGNKYYMSCDNAEGYGDKIYLGTSLDGLNFSLTGGPIIEENRFLEDKLYMSKIEVIEGKNMIFYNAFPYLFVGEIFNMP